MSLQAFESTLKSWEDKQKGEVYRAPSRPRLSSQQSMEYLMEEEAVQMQQLVRATETLISRCQTRQTLKVTSLQSLPWKSLLVTGSCFPAGHQRVAYACGRCLHGRCCLCSPPWVTRRPWGASVGPVLFQSSLLHEVLEELGEQEEGVLHSSWQKDVHIKPLCSTLFILDKCFHS